MQENTQGAVQETRLAVIAIIVEEAESVTQLNTECVRHRRCCDCVAFHRDERGNVPNCFKAAGITTVQKQ